MYIVYIIFCNLVRSQNYCVYWPWEPVWEIFRTIASIIPGNLCGKLGKGYKMVFHYLRHFKKRQNFLLREILIFNSILLKFARL